MASGILDDDGNATFDSPGRAIECALAIREALKAFDIGVRAGIHTGEIEVRGDDVAGMAAHIGAGCRVPGLAGPGDVLVSSTVKDSVVGSSVEFEEQRGEHERNLGVAADANDLRTCTRRNPVQIETGPRR